MAPKCGQPRSCKKGARCNLNTLLMWVSAVIFTIAAAAAVNELIMSGSDLAGVNEQLAALHCSSEYVTAAHTAMEAFAWERTHMLQYTRAIDLTRMNMTKNPELHSHAAQQLATTLLSSPATIRSATDQALQDARDVLLGGEYCYEHMEDAAHILELLDDATQTAAHARTTMDLHIALADADEDQGNVTADLDDDSRPWNGTTGCGCYLNASSMSALIRDYRIAMSSIQYTAALGWKPAMGQTVEEISVIEVFSLTAMIHEIHDSVTTLIPAAAACGADALDGWRTPWAAKALGSLISWNDFVLGKRLDVMRTTLAPLTRSSRTLFANIILQPVVNGTFQLQHVQQVINTSAPEFLNVRWFVQASLGDAPTLALNGPKSRALDMADAIRLRSTLHIEYMTMQLMVLAACCLANVLTCRHVRTTSALQSARADVNARKAFVRYVMHETRVPFSSLKMGLELLQESSAQSDEARQVLSSMREGAESMSRILNDVLDWEKIESGKFTLEMAEMQVASMVHSALHVMRPTFDAKGVACELEIAQNSLSGDITVLGDRHRLRQIVDNLLSNALKFSPSGSRVTVRLDVRMSESARALEHMGTSGSSRLLVSRSSVLSASPPSRKRCGCLRANRTAVLPETSVPVASAESTFSVRETMMLVPWKASSPVSHKAPSTEWCVVTIDVEDHGIGVSEAARGRLFTPFTQINAGANQNGAGTGLGLAICRQLARSHHGDVTCISQEGAGSTFTLKFQAEIVQHDAENPCSTVEPLPNLIKIDRGRPRTSSTCKDAIGIAAASVDASSVSRRPSGSFTNLAGVHDAGRVLVVDDVGSNRVLLAKLLHRYGFATNEADGGVSALQFFNESPRKDMHESGGSSIPTPAWPDSPLDVHVSAPFDAVFLDRNMPGMSGEALAAAIRARGYTGPIIGVTGESPDACDTFRKAGVDYILCKPITIKTLEAALSAVHKLPHP